jgi:hypothetical protein
LQQEINISDNLEVSISGQKKKLSEYRSDVKSLYHGAVNLVLSNKFKKAAKKS